ncbi:HlyD family efflux transporter periplasmic adaptor subunit [Arcobacter sp. CECT 8985]|uniref:HlyD family efflux transporter periplasmic adaptor subunit n=1 Tax=Arcobacter sp. CECT 8985 TaxID=1935424 RepID=UPI00100A9CCF|nr:HlyD family efflux transporter periplasmic adaptor subunit [Arcobacter sp. CECT 8985]RXJ87587.1 hemolysin secretion protein D [Arcobacter sp. CECT 8985]
MKNLLYITTFFSIILIFNGCTKDKQENKFYGNVDVRTVSLGFRVSGKIEKIFFDEGNVVKKGQVLAVLDDSLYKQNLNNISAQIKAQESNVIKLKNGYRKEDINKAKATLAQRKVAMKKAKIDLERNTKLLQKKSISQQKYDDIKLVYDNAKALYDYAKSSYNLLKNGYRKEDIDTASAKLQSLKAQKQIKQINLNDTILKAPTNGTILTRIHEEGSIVNASTPVIQLAKSDEYWIRSYMSEKYLGKIKPGMKATVYTDSSNKKYHATVSFISAVAEFTPKSVQTEDLRTDLVYRFRLILNDYDDKIRQGMPVTIKFDNINE